MSKKRCPWCEGDALYEAYHDKEWGVPNHDDQTFFEFLLLETFQAGLSWITILRKRENFRKAFDGFDYKKIADYTPEKMEALRQDKGIIRNRLKINAAVHNAQQFLYIQEEFGSFDQYIWSFVNHQPVHHKVDDYTQMPSTTPLSDKVSKALKKRGFKFVGSTVVYSFMQAMGLINDHEEQCYRNTALQAKESKSE